MCIRDRSSTGTLNSAEFNVGLGYGVFNSLTKGDGNMATGYNALNSLTEGGGNVAIGRQVLSKLTTGSKNVGIGRQAGIQIVGASVGGNSLTTGIQNTYIGAETVPSANDVSNETVIGYGTTGSGTNSVTIGNSSVTLVAVPGNLTGTSTNTSSNTGTISCFDASLNDVTSSDLTSNAYTLVASDNGKVITIDNSTTDATVNIPTGLGNGFNCLIVQKGNHQTTISHASGSDNIVNRSGETKTNARYAVISIINIGSELYIVSGDTGS